MAIGLTITDTGREIQLNRIYLSSPTKKAPNYFKTGIDNGTPSVASTDLDNPVPISGGTVNDTCEDAFTGSAGGDNSTDNTSTFKEGAVQTDDTAQNLISNTSSASKTWTLTPDTNFVSGDYVGFWLYIKDSTTLAYFLSSGTALEARFGSDSSNYYSLTRTAAQLTTGWNWVSSGTTALSSLAETGTVAGNIDTFILIITTNNATDSWSSGDVVIDLIRQWDDDDLVKQAETGFPSVDSTNLVATTRFRLGPNEAAGFSLDGYGIENEDGDLYAEATTEDKDKTDTDEFIIIVKDTQ